MVVHNLTRWIWEKLSAHVACSMKKEKSPKMTSFGPPTLRAMEIMHETILMHNRNV